MCPRFLFVDTNKSAHNGDHPHSRTRSTHGRNRTLTNHPFRVVFQISPVGSESSDLESATKAVYFAFLNSAKALDAYAYFLYHQLLGPLMNHVAIPICTARMPSRECHLDTSRKRCDMTYRDPNPPTPLPQ